jgi:hypothetical protein
VLSKRSMLALAAADFVVTAWRPSPLMLSPQASIRTGMCLPLASGRRYARFCRAIGSTKKAALFGVAVLSDKGSGWMTPGTGAFQA